MMKHILTGLVLSVFLTGCSVFNSGPTEANIPTLQHSANTVTPSPIPTRTSTSTLTPTTTSTSSPTETSTPAIFGPENFPDDIDPLTGLEVDDPSIFDRRPVAIKINIVPRYSNRPPWGLSFADIVYDYYHNDGYSRFHAIFYGDNADLAGPIRSGRLLDYDLVHMYQSMFVYGSADALINQRLLNADFSNRVLIEGFPASCPPTAKVPLCRYEPTTNDFLLANTADVSLYMESQGVDNTRQDLEGMMFNSAVQPDGVDGTEIYVRYSGDNYTRWDFDPASGSYLRFQDNVFDTGQGEEYAPLLDRLTDEQISAANVIVIKVQHDYYQQPPAEIVEILLNGTGPAYAFRDGQMYEVEWSRPATDSVLSLINSDGTPFPFKPGKTWIQVVSLPTQADQQDSGVWHFQFITP